MPTTRLNNSNAYFSSFNLDVRINDLNSKMKVFEEKMGVEKSVKLALDEFNTTPVAILEKNTIQLPTWFLFKYEDIPPRFRIADLEDARLTDQNFLNELTEWMNAIFRGAGLSSVIRRTDHGVLQTVIKLMRDRDLYERSKDFTLCHELAHLNHVQAEQKIFYLNGIQDSISISGVIGGILLLFLSVAIIPFVHLAVTLAVGGIAAVVSIYGVIAWLNKAKSALSPSSAIEEEKYADMDAVKTLQDASGGIYLFETYRHQNLAIRRSDPTQFPFFDERGNSLRATRHPPLTDRISYLRGWH